MSVLVPKSRTTKWVEGEAVARDKLADSAEHPTTIEALREMAGGSE